MASPPATSPGTSFRVAILNESDCESVARLRNAVSVIHELFAGFAPVSVTLVRGNPAGPGVSPDLSRSYNHFNAVKLVAACAGSPGVIGMVVEDDLVCADIPQARLLLLQAVRSVQASGQVVSLCATSPYCAYLVSPMYAVVVDPANATDMLGAVSPVVPGTRSMFPVFVNGSTAGTFNGVIHPLGRIAAPSNTNPDNPRLALPVLVGLLAAQKWQEAVIVLDGIVAVLQRYSPFHMNDRIVALLFLLLGELAKRT